VATQRSAHGSDATCSSKQSTTIITSAHVAGAYHTTYVGEFCGRHFGIQANLDTLDLDTGP
jgi:hypothetical protein